MAAIDKAIELLNKVLEENYKLSEGYEIKPDTRDEIEEWLKWYKNQANGDDARTEPALPIQNVVCSCYLCGTPIPEEKDQYDMYGEKVCKSCCDEQSELMLMMSGHEY